MTMDEARVRLESDPSGFRTALPALLSGRPLVCPRERIAWARLCQEAGRLELAAAELREAALQAPSDPEIVLAQAALRQECGDPSGAARLLQRALDEAPTDEGLLRELVEVCRSLGLPERAEPCLARAADLGVSSTLVARLRAGPSDSGSAEPVEDSTPGGDAATDPSSWLASLSDADVCRFAALFQGREDTFARQWHDQRRGTGYSPIREPFTPRVVRNHLLGNDTLGVYPIRVDGMVRWFAVDLDISKAAIEVARTERAEARRLRSAVHREGLRLARVLQGLGFDPLLESSGYKGRHLWVFLERPESAARLHELGRLLLALESPRIADGLTLEFFPRQAACSGGKGLGNLIKLPLGIHRRSGRRSLLLDLADGQPLADPWPALRQVRRAPSGVVLDALARLAVRLGPIGPGGAGGQGGSARAARPEPPETAAADAGTTSSSVERAEASGPRPPEVAPGWTSVDFAVDPDVHCLTERCPVLGALRDQAEDNRTLGHEEQVVLRHSLGHVPRGVAAFNYLLDRCGVRSASAQLQSPLRGSPISCARIRQRLPVLTGRVGCDCVFSKSLEHYPTPLLHLRQARPATAAIALGEETQQATDRDRGTDDEPVGTTVPPAPPMPPAPPAHTVQAAQAAQPAAGETRLLVGPLPPEQLARRYGLLVRRVEETRAEVLSVGRVLAEVLRRRPGLWLPVDGGAYTLRVVGGVEEIVWSTAPPNADVAAKAAPAPGHASNVVEVRARKAAPGSSVHRHGRPAGPATILLASRTEERATGDPPPGPPPPLVPPPPLEPPQEVEPEAGTGSATDAA